MLWPDPSFGLQHHRKSQHYFYLEYKCFQNVLHFLTEGGIFLRDFVLCLQHGNRTCNRYEPKKTVFLQSVWVVGKKSVPRMVMNITNNVSSPGEELRTSAEKRKISGGQIKGQLTRTLKLAENSVSTPFVKKKKECAVIAYTPNHKF